MGGVLAVVHEGDGIAVEVGIADGSVEITVGVAPKDEVDATGAGNEFHIVDEAFNLPAEVAEADDHIATFASAKDGNDAVGFGNGVEVKDAFAVLVGNKPFDGWADAKDTNADTLALDDGVGEDNVFQDGGADIVITTNGGEGGKLKEAEHVLLTKVELMIADGGSIVMHGIHKAYLGFSAEEVVVEGALGVVATVEEKQVGVNVCSETVDDSGPTNVASGVGLRVGLDAAVGIGGVEDEKGGRRRWCGGTGKKE